MEENMKIVEYEKWCPKCKHLNTPDYEDPCNECLNEPARPNSHKPVNFKEADDV